MRLLPLAEIPDKLVLSHALHLVIVALENAPNPVCARHLAQQLDIPEWQLCRLRRSHSNTAYARHVTEKQLREVLAKTLCLFPSLQLFCLNSGDLKVHLRKNLLRKKTYLPQNA